MTDRADLPLPDYDHLPLGSLVHRIRSLDAAALRQVLDHERAHGDRVPVVEALTARLDQLAAGAEPSGGRQDDVRPEQPAAPAGGSPVGPQTAAGERAPLRHGVAGQTSNSNLP